MKFYKIILFIFLLIFSIQLFSENFENSYSEEISLKEKITQILKDKKIPPDLIVVIISAMPIFELRGGIPVGIITLELPWWRVFIAAIIGNMIPVPFILFLIGPISKFLSKWKLFDKFFDWWFNRTKKKSKQIEKYRSLGVLLFVAIPLPVTGAWTGSLASFLAGIEKKHSIWAVFLGVICAGIIVTILTLLLSKIGWFGAIIITILLLFIVGYSFFKCLD